MDEDCLPHTVDRLVHTHTVREPSVVEGSLPFSTHKQMLRVTFLLHHSNTTQTNQQYAWWSNVKVKVKVKVKLKTVTPQHKTYTTRGVRVLPARHTKKTCSAPTQLCSRPVLCSPTTIHCSLSVSQSCVPHLSWTIRRHSWPQNQLCTPLSQSMVHSWPASSLVSSVWVVPFCWRVPPIVGHCVHAFYWVRVVAPLTVVSMIVCAACWATVAVLVRTGYDVDGACVQWIETTLRPTTKGKCAWVRTTIASD
jgi:hypothetical protein